MKLRRPPQAGLAPMPPHTHAHTHPHRQGEPGVSALHSEEHLHRVPGRTHALGLGRCAPQPGGWPDAARGWQQAQQRQPLVRQNAAGEDLAGPGLPPRHAPSLGPLLPRDFLPLPWSPESLASQLVKQRGSQKVGGAIPSSSQHVITGPGLVTRVTPPTYPSADQREPGMWGQAEWHNLGRDFPSVPVKWGGRTRKGRCEDSERSV